MNPAFVDADIITVRGFFFLFGFWKHTRLVFCDSHFVNITELHKFTQIHTIQDSQDSPMRTTLSSYFALKLDIHQRI